MHIFLPLVVMMTFAITAQAELRASVDRNSVSINESIALHIESDSRAIIENIDITPLETLFTIVNRASSQNVQIINGNMQTSATLTVRIFPKQQGVLVIPSLSAKGETTEPISIKVLPANNADSLNQPARLSLSSDDKNPYVQQQVIVTVVLELQSGRFIRGDLQEPKIQNAHIKRVNETRNTSLRNGITWEIITRTYALFIQQSGRFVIDPVMFSGELASRQRGFFQTGRQMQFRSKSITFDVHPPEYSDAPWLPADNLTATSELSTSDIEIGQAITRTLRLQVRNQQGELIPNLPTLTIDGLQVHTDGIERNTTNHTIGVDGTAIIRQVFIPQKPGDFIIDQQQLSWWSNADNTRKILTIPASSFIARPPSAAQLPIAGNTPPSFAESNTQIYETQNPTPIVSTQSNWLTYTLACLVIFSVLANLWQWRTKSKPTTSPHQIPNPHSEDLQFKQLTQETLDATLWFETCNRWLKKIGASPITSMQGLVALIAQHCQLSPQQQQVLQQQANDWYYKQSPQPAMLVECLVKIRSAYGYPRHIGLYNFPIDMPT